jgi:DNA-binding MarR family transcriptional regulator
MSTPVSDDDARPDLVLLLSACATRLNDDVLARVRAEVGDDVTYRDGYVFQHLVPGPRSVTALGGLLGVTQQAASKQVADLEARGLVDRRPDPHDARARLVSLTRRGRRAVVAARTARAAIVADLEASVGRQMVASLDDVLGAVSDATGALDHLMARRVRPESSR